MGLQSKVVVRNADRLPSPHWLVTGYPTVPELVKSLSTASDLVVEGSGPQDGEEVWVLKCRPNLVGEGSLSARMQPLLLTQEWMVMVPHSTRLPRRIFPVGSSGPQMSGIVLSSARPAEQPSGAEWRKLAGPIKVTRRRSYTCDAAKPAEVERVIKEIRDEFRAYQKTLFPRNPMPGAF
jgi:hypothetical protein